MWTPALSRVILVVHHAGVTLGAPATPNHRARPQRKLFRRLTAICTPDHDTAILFFSHRPEREWRNKWFVRKDHAKNRDVAEVLYCHTLGAARESGLPVLEVTDAQQRGDGFGARLANAFADAFAQGYEHVIAVGSDCPRLHDVDWTAAVAQLEGDTPVLGPTADERGAYLIGISRAQFCRDAFAALPWQSPDLLDALARHLAEESGATPSFLAARADVNGPRELRALMQSSAPRLRELAARLRRALGAAEPEPCRRKAIVILMLWSARRLRGPPSWAQRPRH